MVRINILLKDGPKCFVGCNQNVKRLSGRRKHLPRAEYSTRRMAHPTYKSDTSSEFPEISRALRYCASSRPWIQGAPSSSNGVSVPLPTDTLVPSTRATPGYRVASVRLRRFGDGFTHPSAVESNQSPRIQPSIGMMVSFALILRSELYIFASSPMVIP